MNYSKLTRLEEALAYCLQDEYETIAQLKTRAAAQDPFVSGSPARLKRLVRDGVAERHRNSVRQGPNWNDWFRQRRREVAKRADAMRRLCNAMNASGLFAPKALFCARPCLT